MKITRQSKEYKEWRIHALNRDKWKCKICGSTKFLHVHHIIPLSKNKKLIIDRNNSVTLCKKCHAFLRYKELAFVSLFRNLINNKSLNKTDQTLFNMILKSSKIKLYRGTVKMKKTTKGMGKKTKSGGKSKGC